MMQTVETMNISRRISHYFKKETEITKLILRPCDLSQTDKTGTISASLSLSQYLPKVTHNYILVSEKVQ